MSLQKVKYISSCSGYANVNTPSKQRRCHVSCLPVYSVLEGVEEVVESFSQSFSPLRLPAEGQEEKPSAESGLEMIAGQTDK